MPPVSKKQARFMRGVASGSIQAPGLSPEKAEEYVSGYPTKSLPERAPTGRKAQRARQSRKAKGGAHLEG